MFGDLSGGFEVAKKKLGDEAPRSVQAVGAMAQEAAKLSMPGGLSLGHRQLLSVAALLQLSRIVVKQLSAGSNAIVAATRRPVEAKKRTGKAETNNFILQPSPPVRWLFVDQRVGRGKTKDFGGPSAIPAHRRLVDWGPGVQQKVQPRDAELGIQPGCGSLRYEPTARSEVAAE